MSQRHALRIGAVSGILGGILLLVGNIVHPRESGQLDDAESLLDVVSRSNIWVVDHVVIMIALALLLGAFYGLTHSIVGEPGAVWARLAWGVAIIGVGLGVAFMLTEVVAMSELADDWANNSGAQKDLALAAGSAIFQLSLTLSVGAVVFLFGATPVLYGVGMLASNQYPSWLGWVGVFFGALAMVSGVVQLFTGVTTGTGLVLTPIGIVMVTLWIIYLGVRMWRKSVAVVGAAS